METTFEQLPKAVAELQGTANDILRLLKDGGQQPKSEPDELLCIHRSMLTPLHRLC